MNKVEITGRITKDIEVKGEETRVARFNVAVDRKLTKEQRGKEGVQTADFVPVVAFGKTAEFLEKYFKKGSAIEITGRIQTGSYTNKDGVKVYTTDVVAEDVGFGVGSTKANSDGNASGNTAPAPSAAGDGFMNIPDGIDGDGFMNIPDGLDEELPFN